MPITYGQYTKQLKLLPLMLHADGSATVNVRWGFHNGGWTPYSEKAFNISADDVSTVLDAPPTPGLSRRDDLSLAVYQFLVDRQMIEAGEIS